MLIKKQCVLKFDNKCIVSTKSSAEKHAYYTASHKQIPSVDVLLQGEQTDVLPNLHTVNDKMLQSSISRNHQ